MHLAVSLEKSLLWAWISNKSERMVNFMKVKNIQQAWYEADKLIPNDYLQDYEASEKAGYSIYRSIVNHYDYICDLGDRLEVNLASGQTVNIWIEQPNTIEEYAECEASTITIRSYVDGSSKDTTRNATEEEKQILKAIIAGALSAIKSGKDKQTAMDVAEYIGIHSFKKTEEGRCNTYDSVYQKIWRCPDDLLQQ